MNTTSDYQKGQRKLFKMVINRLKKAQTISEAKPSLQTLLQLAEHGDVDALMVLGLALLMEDKPWYDAESGRAALEKAADSDSPVAQYYLGKFLLEGEHGIPADPITAKVQLAARSSQHQLIEDTTRPSKLWKNGSPPKPGGRDNLLGE